MNWLQFIDSMVGHLAWPIVVLTITVIFRERIGRLIGKLEELSLPGGVKATFEKELEKGRELAEQIPDNNETARVPEGLVEDVHVVAGISPKSAIVLSFLEIERQLRHISLKLGFKYPNLEKAVDELIKRKLLDAEAWPLFQLLRRTRNSAAHGATSPTTEQALEYERQASFFLGLLLAATDKL
ncbi:DUF4145 domain-containing protein [Bradyrhizobium sp. DOA1]|uniref:DUF4145 domain-containing protein n=1 Tax=Bradyrhizobium sp. DOA1 TaxID=1126616 RepID=UPI00077CB4A2|nr:DUF4145 domain-containing protein [Bradyrhizobium sp. DOA1]KYH02134.1 hypothetical protein SE91_30075 [Bradyrhizobium sp. DOA1]